MRYVEEDDKEGEEGSGEADEDDETQLGEMGQGGETEPSAPRREHARQAGHRGQLRRGHLMCFLGTSKKWNVPILKPVVESWAS